MINIKLYIFFCKMKSKSVPKKIKRNKKDLFESNDLKNYKYEKILTKFNKEWYIENQKYIYYYINTLKNNVKIFRYSEYKNKIHEIRCIRLLKELNNIITERLGIHNHKELENKALKLILKRQLNKKNELSENKFDLKLKTAYDILKVKILIIFLHFKL